MDPKLQRQLSLMSALISIHSFWAVHDKVNLHKAQRLFAANCLQWRQMEKTEMAEEASNGNIMRRAPVFVSALLELWESFKGKFGDEECCFCNCHGTSLLCSPLVYPDLKGLALVLGGSSCVV